MFIIRGVQDLIEVQPLEKSDLNDLAIAYSHYSAFFMQN